MWKSSLTSITERAAKKALVPQQKKLTKTVNLKNKVKQTTASTTTTPTFSVRANALYASQDEFQRQLQTSAFQASLQDHAPPVRALDTADVLLRRAEQLPFTYAQEAFCALLKAGEVPLALQLATFWQPPRPTRQEKRLRVWRRRARQELCETIRALEEVRDAATLKSMRDIFSSSLKEQFLAEKDIFQKTALTYSPAAPSHLQHKLLAPLGISTTSAVLVQIIEAICRLGPESGVSTFEKLLLFEQSACITKGDVVPAGTPHLPFPLYRRFEALQANETVSSALLQQVCPEIANKLVHPSHYSFIDILSLSVEEANCIEEHWKSKDALIGSEALEASSPSAWRRLMARVLPRSPELQLVEEKRFLIEVLSRNHRLERDSASGNLLSSSRAEVVRLLRDQRTPVRRFAAATLIKRKRLSTALRLSPFEIISVYAQSFYSKRSVAPTLCSFCNFAIRRLCRKGRFQDAARLAWNHLSVDCDATRKMYNTNALAVDYAVLSVSRAMQAAVKSGNGQSWMGYRSLALLRLAAASGANATATHCVSVCVGAMQCGVPFAAVKEAVSDVFASDEAQRRWTLNLVRICSDSESPPMRFSLSRSSVASSFRKLLSSICSANSRARDEISLRAPSRSKQLALWESISEPDSNPRLNALMMATFLDASVRKELVEGSPLVQLTCSEIGVKEAGRATLSADDIWSWEVAASIASNCTSPESYQAVLKALQQRRPTNAISEADNLDNLSAVLFSEMDSRDAALEKRVT